MLHVRGVPIEREAVVLRFSVQGFSRSVVAGAGKQYPAIEISVVNKIPRYVSWFGQDVCEEGADWTLLSQHPVQPTINPGHMLGRQEEKVTHAERERTNRVG